MSEQTSEAPAAPIFNPFSPDFLRNPYPAFQQLRASAPIMRTDMGFWVASRYEDVTAILRDKRFGKCYVERTEKNHGPEIWDQPVYASMRNWMLVMDPPDHTRLRKLVARAFAPRRLKALRPRVQQLVDDSLDAVEAKGEMDFLSDFAFPLPVHVICDMLGIPAEERNFLFDGSRVSGRLIDPTPMSPEELKQVNEGHMEQVAFFRSLFERRRKTPDDDIITELLGAADDGDKLSDDELIGNIILLFGAGHETTVNMLGNGMLHLLSNPEEWEKLKADPSLVPSAVEEILRFDSSVQMTGRTALEDVEIGGVTIPAGEAVLNLLGAANRDPEQFDGAEDFKIDRPNVQPTSFGGGIHHCLGAPLARIEGEIALATLIKRLPNLALANDDPDWRLTFTLRGLSTLPVTW
ncbi:MAG: cytochrome P450 [Rhodospirillaceae bacterium]|jgi:cytochrome P450|nr:cytochrome P450 [Rhodospirillaceae bacterium]MBT5191665.1 cytochrome P450 [Rhodospirillaceae bacterium]MBT5895015.1 cytochrome P450 [Rhodospirillaceae bacterium]MBT6430590.1 cytochrome P450 [Rhodospirillaceae bacterium]MBT7663597.1 cytochrome P450 [Rhodospirillaceae bacterium]